MENRVPPADAGERLIQEPSSPALGLTHHLHPGALQDARMRVHWRPKAPGAGNPAGPLEHGVADVPAVRAGGVTSGG
jgi:hypothetical protein